MFTALPRLGVVGNTPIMNVEPIFALALAWAILGQSIAAVLSGSVGDASASWRSTHLHRECEVADPATAHLDVDLAGALGEQRHEALVAVAASPR
jgi:hypothetical protein